MRKQNDSDCEENENMQPRPQLPNLPPLPSISISAQPVKCSTAKRTLSAQNNKSFEFDSVQTAVSGGLQASSSQCRKTNEAAEIIDPSTSHGRISYTAHEQVDDFLSL